METLEKSGEHVTPEQNQYILLKKRSRTKLVLNADSEPEFEGWLKTLLNVTAQLKDAETQDAAVASEFNVTNVESERGRSRARGWGKAPVPTPRSKTPSREVEPPVPEKRTMEEKVGQHCFNIPRFPDGIFQDGLLDREEPEEKQTDNYDKDSLEEFVAKESEITKNTEYQSEWSAGVFVDSDGKVKLELENDGLEEETDDHEDESKDRENGVSSEKEDDEDEAEYEVKWCTPVGVRSDESSSEDEKGPTFAPNQHPVDHKFSDGIVWETIEECEEEEETEAEGCMQRDVKIHEEVGQKASNPPICQEVNQQPTVRTMRPPGVSADQPVVDERMEGWNGEGALSNQLTGLQGLHTGSPSVSTTCTLKPSSQAVKGEAMRPEEYEAMQDEVGNISVRNLATFWEDLTRRVAGEEAEKKESANIKKKWNSMPELKGQVVKRKLPEATARQKVQKVEDSQDRETKCRDIEVVKSDYVVDDVELCRSVSIKDRREMFESLEKASRRETKKLWSSMPSLKQERRLPSPEKVRVSWQDERPVEVRERSQGADLVKTLQELTPSQILPPVTPLVVTNVVSIPGREESNSSSDSLNSSLTSASTVVPSTNHPWELASLQEDSAGEIYTGQIVPGQDFNLFVVENGTEVPLTPLSQRKSLFERPGSERRRWECSQPARSWERPVVEKEREETNSESLPTELVKSSSKSYIEEEQDVLQNINVVRRVKMKFLDG